MSVGWQGLIAFGVLARQALGRAREQGKPSAYFFCDPFVANSEVICAVPRW